MVSSFGELRVPLPSVRSIECRRVIEEGIEANVGDGSPSVSEEEGEDWVVWRDPDCFAERRNVDLRYKDSSVGVCRHGQGFRPL